MKNKIDWKEKLRVGVYSNEKGEKVIFFDDVVSLLEQSD